MALGGKHRGDGQEGGGGGGVIREGGQRAGYERGLTFVKKQLHVGVTWGVGARMRRC